MCGGYLWGEGAKSALASLIMRGLQDGSLQ